MTEEVPGADAALRDMLKTRRDGSFAAQAARRVADELAYGSEDRPEWLGEPFPDSWTRDGAIRDALQHFDIDPIWADRINGETAEEVGHDVERLAGALRAVEPMPDLRDGISHRSRTASGHLDADDPIRSLRNDASSGDHFRI